MKIKGERKEIVWTVELTDSEMASLHAVLHGMYDPAISMNHELRQAQLREHSNNIQRFLNAFNDEADRIDRDNYGG